MMLRRNRQKQKETPAPAPAKTEEILEEAPAETMPPTEIVEKTTKKAKKKAK